MTIDLAFIEGPLKFRLRFAEVDPIDLGVQVWLEVEYSGGKWTAEHLWGVPAA
jgi:hypothetical protein